MKDAQVSEAHSHVIRSRFWISIYPPHSEYVVVNLTVKYFKDVTFCNKSSILTSDVRDCGDENFPKESHI